MGRIGQKLYIFTKGVGGQGRVTEKGANEFEGGLISLMMGVISLNVGLISLNASEGAHFNPWISMDFHFIHGAS